MSFGSPLSGNCGRSSGVSMLSSISSIRAISRAISWLSPVIIFTSTPYCFALRIVSLVSGRGGSRKVRMPAISHCVMSSASVRATLRHRIPRDARSVMMSFTCPWISAALWHIPSTMFGAPFVTLNVTPSRRSVASVRFNLGSNGRNSSCSYLSHSSRSADPSTIVSSASRGGSRHLAASAASTRTVPMLCSAEKVWHASWISILFSVSVPVLSEHSMFTADIISIELSCVTITLCWESSFEPSASVVVTTISMAMGIDTTSSTTVNSSASRNLRWYLPIRYPKHVMHSTSDSDVSTTITFTST